MFKKTYNVSNLRSTDTPDVTDGLYEQWRHLPRQTISSGALYATEGESEECCSLPVQMVRLYIGRDLRLPLVAVVQQFLLVV